jgi:hypothetical protein
LSLCKRGSPEKSRAAGGGEATKRTNNVAKNGAPYGDNSMEVLAGQRVATAAAHRAPTKREKPRTPARFVAKRRDLTRQKEICQPFHADCRD